MKKKRAHPDINLDTKNRHKRIWSTACVIDYHPVLDGVRTLRLANRLVIARPLITIEFDYPNQRTARFTFCRPTGFTRMDLLACIYKGYDTIYKDVRNYHVFGHGISDLYIEAIIWKSHGLYALAMGS